jgi:hypothetical protein
MRRMIVTIFALLFLSKVTADTQAQQRLNLACISPAAYQKVNCGCPVMSKMDEMEIGNIGVMG